MLTFEEWWEINWFETYGWRGKDLVENGWNAAIKNMEALKPSHNTANSETGVKDK